MKYLLLAYVDPQTGGGGTADDALSGNFQRVKEATSVSIFDGLVSLSAPKPGNNLVGYSILEARDLNDAIRIASRMPQVLTGRVEIWPISEEREELLEGAN